MLKGVSLSEAKKQVDKSTINLLFWSLTNSNKKSSNLLTCQLVFSQSSRKLRQHVENMRTNCHCPKGKVNLSLCLWKWIFTNPDKANTLLNNSPVSYILCKIKHMFNIINNVIKNNQVLSFWQLFWCKSNKKHDRNTIYTNKSLMILHYLTLKVILSIIIFVLCSLNT